MSLLMSAAAIAILALAAYVYLAITCFFTQVTFLTAYRLEFDTSKSREKAVRAAIAVFRGRAPFSDLTDADVDRLVTVFALAPAPEPLAATWRAIDRQRDVARLRDAAWLTSLEAHYVRMAAVTN